MYCPNCHQPNPADAGQCFNCRHPTHYFRRHVDLGDPFILIRADDSQPIALKVDDDIQTFRAPTVLCLYRHAVDFGDQPPADNESRFIPLPSQPRQPPPRLKLLTVITDRKIYKPGTEAGIFIIAPDSPDSEAGLEIRLSGQKIYAAKVTLNRDGLALHRYADFKEGEYTVVVTTPDNHRAECSFSAAEFTLSPLIAALKKHEYADQRLTFDLDLLVLSRPYTGPVEFGLQCQVCGSRVVATQKVNAKDGAARGGFDLSGHGGPFHVQVTTPDGHTALVAFPGTGADEREHLRVNTLGQTIDAGLLPWEAATPIRGLYLGPGELNVTPLMLEAAIAEQGRLTAAADITLAQVVTLDPRSGESQARTYTDLKRGAAIEFAITTPYTFFFAGGFTPESSFTGWGVVFRPLAFDARLSAPQTARPGEEIEVHLHLESPPGPGNLPRTGDGVGAFCLLLVYDARLEHESPLPKLAKHLYESIRQGTDWLRFAAILPAADYGSQFLRRGLVGGAPLGMPAPAPAPLMFMAEAPMPQAEPVAAAKPRPKRAAKPNPDLDLALDTRTMVVAPTRMEFPELVHLELFYFEGEAARTVRLGDQIGTWRTRAYVIQNLDCQELTADVQADKPLYAELDLPALASDGDDLTAAVNYGTRAPAELVITTLFGETRVRVAGSGAQPFAIRGPGRVDVRIENDLGADWTVREVARPGLQKVTASQLLILDQGQTARGEKVVAYASPGYVLKDTIEALLRYPFG